MAYRIVPFKYDDESPSSTVFFLCDGELTPLELYLKESGNSDAFAKFKIQLKSISELGFSKSLEFQRIKKLSTKKANDLYEIRINGVAARGFAFLIHGQQVLVIDFFKKVHGGKDGRRSTQEAIKLLIEHRPRLIEALKERECDGGE